MHEFSICRSILREVLHTAEAHGSAKVRRIRLRIGALATLSAAELYATMPLVSRGSLAEGAEIIAERVPLRVICDACRDEAEAEELPSCCGACGAERLRPLNGDELTLVGVDLVS